MSLEILQDPYNKDFLWLLNIEVDKGENIERKKKWNRFWKASEANIEDEVKKMAFLLGIYS